MQNFPDNSFGLYVEGKPLKCVVNTLGREIDELCRQESDCVCLCACVHIGVSTRRMFRIGGGYCESRTTFTLIGKCSNSTFWNALTIKSLHIPVPSYALKRNIVYVAISRHL